MYVMNFYPLPKRALLSQECCPLFHEFREASVDQDTMWNLLEIYADDSGNFGAKYMPPETIPYEHMNL